MADGEFTTRERWLFVVRVAVSAIALVVSLFVILSGAYPDATVKWAFGMAGLVIGYWLR
jgi:hypothetical protein